MRSEETNKKIAILSEQLGEIDEEVEKKRAQLNDKVGGDEQNGNDNGTATITKLKLAIKNIKDEIKDMKMHLGLIEEQIFTLKKNHILYNTEKLKKSKKSKSRSNNKKNEINDDNENNSID
jgi:hypothetical protein